MSPELSSNKADPQKPNPCLGWILLQHRTPPSWSARNAQHVGGQDGGKAVPHGLQLWTRRHSSGFLSVQPLPGRHRLCMWKQKLLAEISLGEAGDLVSSALLISRSLDGNKPPCSAGLKSWTSAPSLQGLDMQTDSLQTLTSSTSHCHRQGWSLQRE